MEEAIYFSHHGVSVSNRRFIIHGKTISLQHVTMVERRITKPPLGFAGVCLMGGAGLLFCGGGLVLVGIFSIIYGAVLWFLAAPRYSVIVHTPAGEYQAYASENIMDVENVLTALNVAVALRGDTR